jgi:hypothetical protein
MLGVCFVPFSAPCDAIFSVAYGENRRSDFTAQSLRCAVCCPAEEITGVRFGDPENVKNGVSRLYLIKFQSVRPIQEHHPPQCPGI